ncbi:MAG TPA: hypothetical protein VFZ23_09490 [Pyrinomonadaceae bacterium]
MKIRVLVTVRLLLKLASVAAMALITGCSKSEPIEAVITIDPAQHYQTMSAWEATAQAGQEFASYEKYRDKLAFDAVNELGINRLRVEVRSGSENSVDYGEMHRAGEITDSEFRKKRYEIINDNEDPFQTDRSRFHFGELDRTIDALVLPMKKLLSDRNETLFVNLNYVDFGSSDFEHKNDPEEYAEFILAAFLHMKEKYGFVPDYVEVVLEPDTDSAQWSARQVANALAATATRLKGNGFEPAFIAPSTTNAKNALTYIDEIAAVPEAIEAIEEFSYHRYSGVTENVLRGMSERAVRYGKRTSMLEWIGADHNTLHDDLKIANVSSWQQYTLAYSGSDEGDSYYKVDPEESDPAPKAGRRTRFLSQYFRYVRTGAVRVAASTTNAELDPVAFRNLNGSFTVVILAASRGTAAVSGLPAGRCSASYTSEEDSRMLMQEFNVAAGQSLVVEIPSAGVVTISTASTDR